MRGSPLTELRIERSPTDSHVIRFDQSTSHFRVSGIITQLVANREITWPEGMHLESQLRQIEARRAEMHDDLLLLLAERSSYQLD